MGLKYAWKHEEAFRIELLCLAILLPLALVLGETGLQKAALIYSCLFVVIVELINSAIEATVDLCSTKPHPLAAAAKDMGSAAVFLSILLVPVVWMLVLTS